MRKIAFEPKNKTFNKVFIKVKYMAGDADYYLYHTYELRGIAFNDWEIQLGLINIILDDYEAIKKLQYHDDGRRLSYDKLKEEHDANEDMLGIFENCPHDSVYDCRCVIDDYELIGYDINGVEYKGIIK